MKRIIGLILALTMVFAVGCSSGPKHLASAKFSDGQRNIEMRLYGEEDKVIRLEQDTVVEKLSDDQKILLENAIKEIKEKYAKIKGVKYKESFKKEVFTEKIKMELGNKETVKSLIDNDLLPMVEKGTTEVSLKETIELLKKYGWTIEKK